MSYIINKTDGTVLTEVIDGNIDQTSTDLTLVGKNATSYGEFFNENFVHVLENFANTSSPNNPIIGQLWYDTSESRLKVYDGAGFKVSGGTIVSNEAPTTITQGDIWIDSYRQQLYFNDGVATILAGPQYTAQQGISGFQTIDVLDTNNINQSIVLLYVARVLLGIFSKTAFTPASPIAGFTGNINVGFNVGNFTGIKFNVPVTQADAILNQDGIAKTAESFVSTTDDSSMLGTISILNSTPLIIGPAQNTEIKFTDVEIQINSNTTNQNFAINSLNNSGFSTSFYINAFNKNIGLFTNVPTATLDVNGDARIRGDLLVEGDTTTINTTNLSIEDLSIELGNVETPSNSTATGGGILLHGGGDGDKTLTWLESTESWTSSENIDLAAGKIYNINGFGVLSQTSLGVTVTSAPGLTSIGTLSSLQVDDITINGNVISYINSQNIDGDVVLTPKGAGTVNISNKRITDLADPLGSTDAVNQQTLEAAVQTAPLGLSINLGILTDSQIITNILNKIYPPSEHQDSAKCRVWCIDIASAKEFTIVSNAWTFTANI